MEDEDRGKLQPEASDRRRIDVWERSQRFSAKVNGVVYTPAKQESRRRIPTYVVDSPHYQNMRRGIVAWSPNRGSCTRSHLSADTEKHLGPWKDAFPDPSTSPACYTETLYIGCAHAVTDADAEASGCQFRGFSRALHLWANSLGFHPGRFAASFAPLFYSLFSMTRPRQRPTRAMVPMGRRSPPIIQIYPCVMAPWPFLGSGRTYRQSVTVSIRRYSLSEARFLGGGLMRKNFPLLWR